MKVTSIVPVEDVTKVVGGINGPERVASTGADVEPPAYTLTKSYPSSVLNAENESVTDPHVWMSHELWRLAA